jgi:excisionase family DNA binding protein
MENPLIKPHMAAQMLGVHTNTLRNWAAQGIITERRTPTNHRLFNREEIETLKNQIQQNRE